MSAMGLAIVPCRSWVEISRARIAANFRAVCGLVGGGVDVMPVVKADAYRHGSVEVARTLEENGARWLAVSGVEEGVALRQAGIGARILVMASFLPFESEALLDYDLTPTVHDRDNLESLDKLGRSAGRPLPFHLKIDTGMGRMGTRASATEVATWIRRASHTRLEGLMTHFASAANFGSPQTSLQTSRFEAMRAALAAAGICPKYRHLASTIPVAYGLRDTWGNLVRPGHAIYGYVSPARGNGARPLLEVKPALAWKAAVLLVKDLPAGAPVGYGAMFVTQQPTRVAIIAAGYADGVPHRLSNKGRFLACGKYAAVLGAVSMDLTAIDVTASPELRPGDAVTLIGEENGLSLDAQQMARSAGTISYSVLCGISPRVKRLYL